MSDLLQRLRLEAEAPPVFGYTALTLSDCKSAADELDRLRAENAALQKTNASLRADIENPSPDMQERALKLCRHFEIVCELRAENAQLRQQVEGLRAIVIPVGLAQDRMREDAERYRWLRAHGDADGCPSCWCYYDGIHMQQGEMLDAAIDAARV